MSSEYRQGRSEGLALSIFGLAVMVSGQLDPEQTVNDMAAWLHANGGDAFVLRLADACNAEVAP